MSERDAFKTELRIAVGKARPDMKGVLKTIAEMNPYDTSSMEYVVSLAKSAIESFEGAV